jgi:hypothetical protein
VTDSQQSQQSSGFVPALKAIALPTQRDRVPCLTLVDLKAGNTRVPSREDWMTLDPLPWSMWTVRNLTQRARGRSGTQRNYTIVTKPVRTNPLRHNATESVALPTLHANYPSALPTLKLDGRSGRPWQKPVSQRLTLLTSELPAHEAIVAEDEPS